MPKDDQSQTPEKKGKSGIDESNIIEAKRKRTKPKQYHFEEVSPKIKKKVKTGGLKGKKAVAENAAKEEKRENEVTFM